jgi:hypothetical protein
MFQPPGSSVNHLPSDSSTLLVKGIQLFNIEPLQLTHPVVYPSSHLQYSSFKFRLAPSALLLLLPSTQLELHFSRSIPQVNRSLTRPLSFSTAS